MSSARLQPVGVILAGGLGRRMGGAKACVELAGRPLIDYPLRALRAALADVAVLAKDRAQLPDLEGVPVWLEPPEPRHPLAGILHALALSGGRAVLLCAVDLPFVTADLIARLARADPGGAPAVIAAHRGQLQPLLGCYQQAAAPPLAAFGFTSPLRDVVAGIGPRVLAVGDADLLFNVNAPEDLATAAAILEARYPNVKS